MNRWPIRIDFFSLLLLASFIFISSACAMSSKKPGNKSFELQQSYVWHDGDRERTIWLNPRLVAEINPGSESREALKRSYPFAGEIPAKYGSIRIWNMASNITAKTAIQNLKSSNAGGQYSPVLHDGLSSSSRMRALPGNVIVHLDFSWEKTVVDAWLKNNDLEVVKTLNIGPNVFVIKTDPGLASLETANRIYGLSGVVAAYPDWWKEVVAR